MLAVTQKRMIHFFKLTVLTVVSLGTAFAFGIGAAAAIASLVA